MTDRYFPYVVRHKSRAQNLRRDATTAERKLWYEFLRTLPQRFSRQKPLVNYIVDFYCSRSRLAIEIDGDTHYTDAAQRYDQARTAALHALGIRVIRFTNEEVMKNFEGVCGQILRALKT